MKRRKRRAFRMEPVKKRGKILLGVYFSITVIFFALSFFAYQLLLQVKYEKTPDQLIVNC